MPTNLYTIGYEGADISDFIFTLAHTGVTHVIDIRDIPASRKPGFSKKALASKLDENGISYTHLKALGDPKPGREAMRGGDYPAFLEIYSEHVELPQAQSSLAEATVIATGEPSALLCFERDPKHCHRTLVATLMKRLAQFTVTHLSVTAQRVVRSERTAVDGADIGATYAIA